MTKYAKAPESFLDPDGGPHYEIMALTAQTDVTLDWVFDMPDNVPSWFRRWKLARALWSELGDKAGVEESETDAMRGAVIVEDHAFAALLVPPTDLEDVQAQAEALAILKESESDSDIQLIEAMADIAGSFGRRISIASYALGIEPFSQIEQDDEGYLIVSDGLLNWVETHGICLNWLASGDVKSMIRSSAGVNRRSQEMAESMSKMDDKTFGAFKFGLEAILSGQITAKEATEQLVTAVQAQRTS